MKIGRIIKEINALGMVAALLVLLLALRVAAAAALECQHELAAQAAQAKITAHAQHMGDGPTPSAKHDKHHLYTPCPFFTAAGVLPDCGAEPDATDLVYSRTHVKSDDFRVAAGALPAAYSPRAPPGLALG